MKATVTILPPVYSINFVRVKESEQTLDVGHMDEQEAIAYSKVIAELFMKNWAKRAKQLTLKAKR